MAENTIRAQAPTVAAIQEIGAALGRAAQAGDLVMLNGPLGAGKTTFTQGVARALGVRGRVQSPTFVIAQIHRGDSLDLVHVDAYRLSSMDELDALDLDTTLDAGVTVIEWGQGKTEVLAPQRLEIEILRPTGAGAAAQPEDLFEDAERVLIFHPYGERGAALAQVICADPKVAQYFEPAPSDGELGEPAPSDGELGAGAAMEAGH